ncbi:MAG: hypothetical protein KN64_13625 [Sulfurovum sp. AS07-7]|nr:MAG: hypothetical protein KN64_13625 [Sulfurovum sp. AS07-7]
MNNKYSIYKIIKYRSGFLLLIFIVILILLVTFLISIASTMFSERQTGYRYGTIVDKAIRGKIISQDGYTLSFSEPKFEAQINTLSIDPTKKELFVKLFSIYSDIKESEVLERFQNKNGALIRGRISLSKNLSASQASRIKELNFKLKGLKVFRPLDETKPHLVFGLDVIAISENRRYPYENVLTPVVGYTQNEHQQNSNYLIPKAQKGLEKAYNPYIKPYSNGFVESKKDALGTVLRDGDSNYLQRVDGMDLYLNVPVNFQFLIEEIIDKAVYSLDAQEIMVGVMESKTGKIRALASTSRFNPEHILKKDVNRLNPHFAEYLYEPGSVIKPITMAIALENKKITTKDSIDVEGGVMEINKKYIIKDDEAFTTLTPEEILTHSSNIGIAKIAWRNSGAELFNGYSRWGLAKKSGIDLSIENVGRIKTAQQLDQITASGGSSYGYGMFVNFAQLLRAYSAFNNEGIMSTPQIVDYVKDSDGKVYDTSTIPPSEACSIQTANEVKNMLISVVQNGTGKGAIYDGLEVGGKTGTAHVAKNGAYIASYHSSFYGFVNDERGAKYTIGVFVIKPRNLYFASEVAVPVFHKVVEGMVKFGYLKPTMPR